jgi:hypothetical protein
LNYENDGNGLNKLKDELYKNKTHQFGGWLVIILVKTRDNAD